MCNNHLLVPRVLLQTLEHPNPQPSTWSGDIQRQVNEYSLPSSLFNVTTVPCMAGLQVSVVDSLGNIWTLRNDTCT